jgi:hypothetical protein|tara:strand:+ start:21366 stop:21575 length:210 start_codon:yes stop_codon:yes gene_type:complete
MNIIIYTLLIIILGIIIGSYFMYYIQGKNNILENITAMEEDEIEYTCCNIEITGEIRDYGLCPKCLEHL